MIRKSVITTSGGNEGDRPGRRFPQDLALTGQVALAGDVRLDPRLDLLGASLEHLTGCYRKLTPAGKAAGRRQREAAAAV